MQFQPRVWGHSWKFARSWSTNYSIQLWLGNCDILKELVLFDDRHLHVFCFWGKKDLSCLQMYNWKWRLLNEFLPCSAEPPGLAGLSAWCLFFVLRAGFYIRTCVFVLELFVKACRLFLKEYLGRMPSQSPTSPSQLHATASLWGSRQNQSKLLLMVLTDVPHGIYLLS